MPPVRSFIKIGPAWRGRKRGLSRVSHRLRCGEPNGVSRRSGQQKAGLDLQPGFLLSQIYITSLKISRITESTSGSSMVSIRSSMRCADNVLMWSVKTHDGCVGI